jgi:hypothetical protein
MLYLKLDAFQREPPLKRREVIDLYYTMFITGKTRKEIVKEIFIFRTRKGDLLIEVIAWAGVTVLKSCYILS